MTQFTARDMKNKEEIIQEITWMQDDIADHEFSIENLQDDIDYLYNLLDFTNDNQFKDAPDKATLIVLDGAPSNLPILPIDDQLELMINWNL